MCRRGTICWNCTTSFIGKGLEREPSNLVANEQHHDLYKMMECHFSSAAFDELVQEIECNIDVSRQFFK